MKRRAASAVAALLVLATSWPVSALELRETEHAHVAITVPDGWTLSSEGTWSMADAPDHLAHLRVASHDVGLLGDHAAEAYLVDLIARTWGTYTVDRHVRRVTCGRFTGLEIAGHGSGDGWDRAKFHVLLLVDPQSAASVATARGVVVLMSSRADAWDAVHPALERAVHALHAG